MKGLFHRKSLSILALMALNACASLETGYIDYRRAEDPVDVAKRVAEYPRDCMPKTIGGAGNNHCKPLLGVKLFRKNVSRKPGIRPDEVYSIRLDYGYMKYVSELPFTPGKLMAGKNPFRSQAEIVVLARAFEFQPKDAAAITADTEEKPADASAQENAFVDLDAQSLNSARVIYYSPDVENGQGLNFSNIPITGPTTYGGRPVGIQIIVLELDRVSEEMKGLLSSLASLGQTSGALPTGGAANILLNLGKSLLESNQDDVVFEYRFVLDPSSAQISYNSAPFEEGRYVLRRLHKRNVDHIWRNLELDHNSGQLFVTQFDQAGSATGLRPFSDDTYFTVNIVNHGAGAQEAAYVNRRLSDLRVAIESSASADNKTLTAIDTVLQASTKELRGDILVRDLTRDWEDVVGRARTYANNIATAGLPGTCTLIAKAGDKNKAQFELLKAVVEFSTSWNDALQKGTSGNALFEASEQRKIAGYVGGFFMSIDTGGAALGAKAVTADMFLDTMKFQTLMTRAAPDDLAETTAAYAGLLAAKNCDELIALGLAKP